MTDYLERTNTKAVQNNENAELANIKGKMFLSRQFPRNIETAIDNIKVACHNPKLAEMATYSYPKGGQEIKGASIRLAEVIAQNWGNFICGVKELERTQKGSTCTVFAWDLETNFQDEKSFEIEFVRNTKKGSYAVTDEREKYEMMANYAARRKRACILAVIPQYVVDTAIEECDKTLSGNIKEDELPERREKMLEAFKAYGDWITPEIVAEKFGKNFDALNVRDIVKLQRLYASIKDGFISADQAFGRNTEPTQPSIDEQQNTRSVTDMVRENIKKAKEDVAKTSEAEDALDAFVES